MRSVRLGKPDAAVEPVTGVSSHSSADEGTPLPIKLSPRRKGWFIHELDDYFASRPRGIHPTKK